MTNVPLTLHFNIPYNFCDCSKEQQSLVVWIPNRHANYSLKDSFCLKCKSCLKNIYINKNDVKIIDDKTSSDNYKLVFVLNKPFCNCSKKCKVYKLSWTYNEYSDLFYVSCENCDEQITYYRKDWNFICKRESAKQKINRLNQLNKKLNILKYINISIALLLILATVVLFLINIMFLAIIALVQTLIMFCLLYRIYSRNKNVAKKIRVAEQEYNEEMLPEWEKIIEESEKEILKNETCCSRAG